MRVTFNSATWWLIVVSAITVFASSCGSDSAESTRPETVQAEVQGRFYNIQLLTPDWLAGSESGIFDTWPNDPGRLASLARVAWADCPPLIGLAESVTASRRRAALDVLDGAGCERAGQGYQEVTLQHDWDVLEEVATGPEYFKLVLKEGLGEILGDSATDRLNDVTTFTELLDPVNALRNDTDLQQSVGPPLPIIDEEVGVFSLYPVIGVAQHEFTQAGGLDRLAAKGALMIRVHVPNTDELPAPLVRVEGADPLVCALGSPLPQGGGIVAGAEPQGPTGSECFEPSEDVDRPTNGANIAFVVTHLQAGFGEVQSTQVDELLDFIEREWNGTTPLVVVGDFNLNPANSDYSTLLAGLDSLSATEIATGVLDATNKEGWLESESRACQSSEIGPGLACEGASHIDHVFTTGLFGSLSVARDYEPSPADLSAPWTQSIVDDQLNSTHSDHAQLEFTSKLTLPLYEELPPIDEERNVSVTVHTLRAGVGDGVCGEPDPQISATLRASGQESSLFAGPTDDLEWLTVEETISVTVQPGDRYAFLTLDASEYDDFLCGGDDELDITPFPESTNAVLRIDLAPERGDVRWFEAPDASGVGWVNGGPAPVSNAASSSVENLVNFSVNVAIAS